MTTARCNLLKENLSQNEEVEDIITPETKVSDYEIKQKTELKNIVLETEFFSSDISEWSEQMNKCIDYWIRVGSLEIQNNSASILDSKSYIQYDRDTIRKCKTAMFDRKMKNQDLVKRTWLCFSPITGKVYCFYCRLFSSLQSQFTCEGYCDWKNASQRLQEHENSKRHLEAVYTYTLRNSNKGVDSDLKNQIECEKNYWKMVLERVISVIIYLTERTLPFRGDNEVLGVPNNGNFLGAIELLAKYDDFLKAHLHKYAQSGKGKVNYLSSSIYEELIDIMHDKLLNKIIENLKKSKYFAISVDSTTDVGHVDQLCLTVRYI